MKVQELVQVTNFESLRFLNARTSKKIEALNIQNCTTFEEALSGLTSEHFREFFHSNHGLVLFVIEMEESLKKAMKHIFDLEHFKFDCDGRPWIVQITSTTEPSSMIFFKDAEFSHIYISTGKIINRGPLCDDNDFNDLIEEILPNILRSPSLSLLGLSLTLDHLNLKTKTRDLRQKFLNIFVDSATEPACKIRKFEPMFTQEQIKEAIEAFDGRHYNALMVAIEQKNLNHIETLIELDFDLAQRGTDGKHAVDLTIDKEMFDVFVKLIESDSPFPSALEMEKIPMQSNAFEKLLDVCKERHEFHSLISDGDMESLKIKVSQNFRTKFAYDVHNKSALTYAIEQKQFDVFAFLQSQGFSKGIDPFYVDAIESLTDDEKDEIASYNLKYFQNVTSTHVNVLISKTKIASRVPDRSKSYEEIWKFYNDLDEINEVSEVFQVVALFENLTISFDFENFDVHNMHPSQTTNTSGAFFEGGYIYIAAGQWQSDRNNVLGVIAHEFTHCALQKIYKNLMLPYKAADVERAKEFAVIVESTEMVVGFEDDPETIISLVFSNAYKEQETHKELVVRVPHLLAKYKDDADKVDELKLTFVDLFTFYETKTRPDLASHPDIVRLAEQVRALNEKAGLLRLVRKEEIELDTNPAGECFERKNESKVNVVVSSSAIHSIAAIIKHLDQHEIFHVTIDLTNLLSQLSSIQGLLESNQKLFVIINCVNQVDECQKEFFKIIRGLEKQKIFLIFGDDFKKLKLTFQFDESNSSVFEFNHKWEDLTKNYQTRIMQKIITFQGNLIALGELLGNVDSCPALKFLPLYKFVEDKHLTVNDNALRPFKFYFPRRFFIESERRENSEIIMNCEDVAAWMERKCNPKSVLSRDNVANRVMRQNFAIISGIAGSGKSSALEDMAKKLKQKFPDRWVSFVDLKLHFKIFKREPSPSTFEKFAFHLTSSRSDDKNFELEMFRHFYGNGKVLLLLDGFDEICPHYKQIVTNFLKKFQRGTGNQLWITTRSHLQSYLEKLFGVSAFELFPFTEDEQVEFLLGFWQKNSEASKQNSKLEARARSVVKSLNDFLFIYRDTIGIPLLMEIVASMHEDNVCGENPFGITKTFNLYSLYGEYFDRKFEIWRRDKGKLSEYDQKQIDKSGNAVLLVHQKLAMKLLFALEEIDEFEVSVEFDEKIWTDAALARVGLILSSDTQWDGPEFMHRTFAEFLLAQYVVHNLGNKNRTQALKIFIKILDKEERVVSQFLNFALSDHEITSLSVKHTSTNDKAYFKREILNHGVIAKVIKTENQERIFWLFIEIAKQILTLEEIKSMLKVTNFANVNIIHVLSKYGGVNLIQEVFSFLKEFLNSDEINELFTGNDGDNLNFLHRAARNSLNSFKALFEIAKPFLSLQDHKKLLNVKDSAGQNVFLHAAEKGKHEYLSALIEVEEQILNEAEIKSMLKKKDKRGQNIFSQLFGNIRPFETFKNLKKYFSDEETHDMIFSVDSEGNHFLKNAKDCCSSPEAINILFTNFKVLLSDEQQKQLLRIRNKKNQNIFALPSWKQTDDDREYEFSLAALIRNAREILPEDEVQTMLKESNVEQGNIMTD